nr:MAG TPA: hypothetical protein [Caudoviricetes sp.]
MSAFDSNLLVTYISSQRLSIGNLLKRKNQPLERFQTV